MSLLRAVIRCECQGCTRHSRNRCRLTAATRAYRSRHPVVMHCIDGQLLCHLCLGRKLEFQRRRLYPEVIPLPPGAY